MGLPIIGDIINAAKDIISEVVVDKDKKRELDVRLQELADEMDARYHEEVMGQIEVNKIEAGHRSIFVAGWRPFIGWVGGASLAWTFILSPMLVQVFELKALEIDTAALIQIVLALLGIGAMRSFDKVKGVSNDVLPLPSPTKVVKKLLPENAPWMK